MTSTLSAAVILLLCCLQTPALAESCREPLRIQTPCEGVLLPDSAATAGINCLRTDVPRLSLELERVKAEHTLSLGTCQLDLEAERRSREVESQSARRIQDLLVTQNRDTSARLIDVESTNEWLKLTLGGTLVAGVVLVAVAFFFGVYVGAQ